MLSLHLEVLTFIQASLPWQHFICLLFGHYSPRPVSKCEIRCSFRKSSQKDLLKTLACWGLPAKPSSVEVLASLDPISCRLRYPSLYYIPGLFHQCSFLLFWPTLHKRSFIHHWQNYKSHFPCFPCPSLLSPFPTCTSSLSLFYCYAFSLINRCLFLSDLWFAKPSPPYGSGEAISVFLVLQFSQECNFLGKRKKKEKKKERKSSPSYQNPFIHF